KPSSPQLYPGHRLSDEIPVDYSTIDPILIGLFEENLPADKVSEILNIQVEIVNDIKRRYMKSMHKRLAPPAIETERINS
ncbi:MAG: hypothetical protein N3E47_06410, partial [Candidatus Bathyarchaeota archaeon]|nr:hypothetical protein [Candidatus Bathyarchaeota archaeon]